MHQIYLAQYVAVDGSERFREYRDLSEAIKMMFLFESLGCRILSVKDLKGTEYYFRSGIQYSGSGVGVAIPG